ncbi:hypothetical protein KIPB_006313 [Kipferlia bialata]|uniref:Uncharacterized protein n=1 Tax=Kipferlia bialata TaxID=797122 RepID=A0A9K3CWV2_9EUKA|nr:hypothetical protein KIPB_006313 [Kipferlia bialata]|eukprot:g6313.t1
MLAQLAHSLNTYLRAVQLWQHNNEWRQRLLAPDTPVSSALEDMSLMTTGIVERPKDWPFSRTGESLVSAALRCSDTSSAMAISQATDVFGDCRADYLTAIDEQPVLDLLSSTKRVGLIHLRPGTLEVLKEITDLPSDDLESVQLRQLARKLLEDASGERAPIGRLPQAESTRLWSG